MSIAQHATQLESAAPIQPPKSRRGEWTWELVKMFPQQGEWTEEAYLAREFDGLVEYSDGVLEFLPMPSLFHQVLVGYLYIQLARHVQSRDLGIAAVAPLPVRISDRNYREPDVVFTAKEHVRNMHEPVDGADLVMEVVSDSRDARDRDLIEKRKDYAAAGIPEYWIIDSENEAITVLVLEKDQYKIHGEFKKEVIATSVLLPGFEVDVSACFDAGRTGQFKI